MTTGNQYAMAALMTLCFILRAKRPKLLSWASLVFISLLAGVILSGARTAYVAFAGALLVQFLRKRKYSKALKRAAALVFVPIILLILSQPKILARAATILYFGGDSNVRGRFTLYQKAVEEFSNSPIVGVGFGRFTDSGKTYYGLRHLVYIATAGKEVGKVENLNEAHDSYLQFLAEGGLVGLVLMLGVWVSTYRWAGRMRRKFHVQSEAAAFCEGVQASVLATFFSSLTGTTMLMATTPLFVFTMVGLLRNVVAWECRAQAVKSTSSLSRIGLPSPTSLARSMPS
ncbi:MAG TPA: O-antigen ligase family protein [Candidatus Acidoferrales bacterium]|nr:O-antigen ligase family protein [Candidatus Acidoferrales bacterium]